VDVGACGSVVWEELTSYMLAQEEGVTAMAAAVGLSNLVLDEAFDRRRDHLVSATPLL
jgi:hypothetical protein